MGPLALLCRRSVLSSRLSTWVLLGYTASTCSGQDFWSGRAGSYTQQGWGYDTSSAWVGRGRGRPGSRASKVLPLRTQIRHIRTPPRSLVKLSHLALQMSIAAGWDYNSGTVGRNLVCPDLSAGCCELLPPSQSQSDSQWPGPADSPTIPMKREQSGDWQEVTHSAENCRGDLWAYSSCRHPVSLAPWVASWQSPLCSHLMGIVGESAGLGHWASLQEGHWGQHVTARLILWLVLSWPLWYRGCFSFTTVF